MSSCYKCTGIFLLFFFLPKDKIEKLSFIFLRTLYLIEDLWQGDVLRILKAFGRVPCCQSYYQLHSQNELIIHDLCLG